VILDFFIGRGNPIPHFEICTPYKAVSYPSPGRGPLKCRHHIATVRSPIFFITESFSRRYFWLMTYLRSEVFFFYPPFKGVIHSPSVNRPRHAAFFPVLKTLPFPPFCALLIPDLKFLRSFFSSLPSPSLAGPSPRLLQFRAIMHALPRFPGRTVLPAPLLTPLSPRFPLTIPRSRSFIVQGRRCEAIAAF